MKGFIVNARTGITSDATESKSGLMTPNEKTKLKNIAENATRVLVDDTLKANSANPVQNKIIVDALNKKQNTLKQGANITIASDGTISAKDTTYPIAKSDTDGLLDKQSKVKYDNYEALIEGKQDKLTAGRNISISADGIISVVSDYTILSGIEVAPSSFTDISNTSEYYPSGFPLRASVVNGAIKETDLATLTASQATTNLNIVSVECNTYNGGVYIYVSSKPSTNLFFTSLTLHEYKNDQRDSSVGISEKDSFGLEVDYENKLYTRLYRASGQSMNGDAFNRCKAFGGRRRCNVADDGTILAYYGDSNYKEDGSNGQVMVYQPAFYYKVEPVKLGSDGYTLLKARYFVSDQPISGFKLHKAFYNQNGSPISYVLIGAYEGSLYDKSAGAYIKDDAQVANFNEDLLSSIANVKPISGLTQQLTRGNALKMAKNRGNGWYTNLINIISANQLLMMVELAGNFQNTLGSGVCSSGDNSSFNCSSLTGSTSVLGNVSGRASSTINTKGDAKTTETANNKTSVTYRGMENPYANIWEFVDGINVHGNGSMGGGKCYICTDFNFADNKNSGNYSPMSFNAPNDDGYIQYFGYDKNFDYIFMTCAIGGNSTVPVGDYFYKTKDLNGFRIARLGGNWDNGSKAGGFYWHLDDGSSNRWRHIGARLSYVPIN